MSVAVVTIVAGRHAHLRHQQRGLRDGERLPDHYVVVGMGDEEALRESNTGPLAASSCAVHPVPISADGPLPLATARNAGAAAALDAGAGTIIFLDVDCIPAPTLVTRYDQAVQAERAPALHCGVVRYLSQADSDADPPVLVGTPHPSRPVPGPGEATPSTDWPLFWSLSFATSSETWRELGGFCELYRGYGAEDTDLGYLAHLSGVNLQWIGGADAFHQYHPTQSPPVGHLTDIIANATVFHGRWGFWPMQGWLTAFQAAGLAVYDPILDRWFSTATP